MNLKNLQDTIDGILEKPILTTFLVLVFITLSVGYMSYPHYMADRSEFFRDVLVELHGTAFDLVVIGIMILWLNQLGERRLRVRSYTDEIEDFRDWKAEEAKFRVIGNIRRLNRDNITKISLYNYVISKATFTHLNLSNSNLNYTDLSGSKFTEINLKNALMNQVNLSKAQLNTTNLIGSKLNGANMESSSSILCNYEGAHFINANMANGYFLDVNFKSAIFWEANLKDAGFYKVDFSGVEGLTPEMLAEAKTFKDCKMDPELEKAFKKLVSERKETAGQKTIT